MVDNSRPRALLIAPLFTTAGGDTRFIECIKRGLFKDLHIVTGKSGEKVLASLGLHNVKSHIISNLPENENNFLFRSTLAIILSPLVRMILYSLSLPNLIRARIRPDLTISTTHYLYDLILAIFYSQITKSKLVVYIHHLFPPLSIRSKYNPTAYNLLALINDILSIRLIRLFAYKVMTYPVVVPQAINIGVSKHKIQVTMDGVPLKYISKVKGNKKIYDACYVGRISLLKGVLDLVDIWERVCLKKPDAKMAIVGMGESQLLAEAIEKKGLSKNIILKGYLPENEKYVVMKSSRLFVFPSYEEGLGIVIIEAMACGLPVVTYRQPAYTVFGTGALIKVPVGNKILFSDTVLTLLYDEKRISKMSYKSKEISNKFDWDNLVEKERLILFN
jgi:glycosyltransferase involved in cell wall biosynthesis|tara:strand:+ start:9641 stop:10810 length:1170 start_codon:yes stop_codon:yes gene_type:complete